MKHTYKPYYISNISNISKISNIYSYFSYDFGSIMLVPGEAKADTPSGP